MPLLPHRPREPLRPGACFTGYTLDGGYAEEVVADRRYCLPLPGGSTDAELAPLLCAGLIGYRALRAAGDAERLGLYGFGAAAHIVAQLARHEERRVLAFTRPGDEAAQSLAREVGAEWAGAVGSGRRSSTPRSSSRPPGARPRRSAASARHGRLRGHPHEPDPPFLYELLWGERVLRSVANLTRADGASCSAVAEHPV